MTDKPDRAKYIRGPAYTRHAEREPHPPRVCETCGQITWAFGTGPVACGCEYEPDELSAPQVRRPRG